jgi:hypothetical protein
VAHKKHRLVLDDGRVVIADGSRDAWWVYMEDDPEHGSMGSLDGLVVAEVVLGIRGDDDEPDVPPYFDEWVEKIKGGKKQDSTQ